jgi:chromate reductase
VRILGIPGSVRRGSHNRALVRAAGRALPPGAALVQWNGLAGIPAFNEDEETSPPGEVAELRQAILDADAVLIATPEYNHSVPGALKNALDWASRPFPDNALRDKPCLVIGASTGIFGAVWAQAELRKALRASGARVLDHELAIGSCDVAFTQTGAIADPELAERLASLLAELVAVAERTVGQPA